VYFWLANAVVCLHLAAIVVLAWGLAAMFTGGYSRYPRFYWFAYTPVFFGVILSDGLLNDCFLTLWEKRLLELHAAGSAYHGTFFDNYLPFLSDFINKYGLGIILAGTFFQVALWLRARRTLKKKDEDAVK
jgi:hypothetical protein